MLMKKVEHEDTHLWNRFKAGDKSALHEIYSGHIDGLLQYGYRFSQDRSIIEDCIHDLFVYLWSNRKTIGHTDTIRSYLLVVLRRRMLRAISGSSKLNQELTSYEATDFELNIESQIIDAETDAEQMQHLKKAMEDLSARQKEAIYLKYYKNHSYDDICTIMNINYQSARNLVFSGVTTLRKIMSLFWWLVLPAMG